MSRDIAPFGVRMPNEIKEQLTQKAYENKRSLNAEIVARLTDSLTYEQDFPATADFVSEIDEKLSRLDKQMQRVLERLGLEDYNPD